MIDLFYDTYAHVVALYVWVVTSGALWVIGFGLLGGVFRRWLGYGDNVSRWVKLVFGSLTERIQLQSLQTVLFCLRLSLSFRMCYSAWVIRRFEHGRKSRFRKMGLHVNR